MDSNTAYEGRTILHCHILAHEDQGAMAWMDVIGGLAPPVFPTNGDIGLPYSEYYALGGDPDTNPPAEPTDLSTTPISSSVIDLAWTDNSGNETGFEIESSTDGVTFAATGTTAANVTDFSDSGLTAGTTYYYQVRAFNDNGDSTLSNISSAMTEPAGQGGTSLQVGSISVSTINQGRGVKRGQVEVIVVDDQGTAVADAVVSGNFTGDINESNATSSPTDSNGSTTITTAGSTKPLNTLTFCITGISHSTLADFSGSECGSL